ncbi:MAG TPA: hypothetical protein DCR72_01760 [Pseudomonas sp.]|nr:hypothetical protein [Pseudomonas sp.]
MSYYTVVFHVEDDQKFRMMLSPLLESMASGEPHMGAVVTGAGIGDSMTREEQLAALLDEHDIDYSDIAPC